MRNHLLLLFTILFFSTCTFSPPDLELIRLTLENKYRWVGQFDPDTHIATMYENMQLGYVDINGKEILPLGEYSTCDFSDGIGIYYKYNKEKNNYTHYAIDKTGQVLKIFKGLDFLQKFEGGVAIASDSTGKYGLLMFSGKTKVSFKYRYLERLSSRYFLAQDSNGYGLIDTNGKIIIPHLYAHIIHVDTVSLNTWAYKGSVGYAAFDSTGKLLKGLPGKNIDIESFSIEGKPYYQRDGLILLENDSTKELSVVNLDFETIVPFGKYVDIDNINDGRIEVSLKIKSEKLDERVTRSHSTQVGFLDYTGKVVIQPDNQSAIYFTEGLCAVARGGKWGYIDRGGKVVIPFQYTYCLPFSHGYAKVQLGDKFYIIDKSGKIVLNSKPYW